MSVSILETLQNAKINLVENAGTGFGELIGRGQLTNALILLEKGYPLEVEIDPILEAHPDLNTAPEYME